MRCVPVVCGVCQLDGVCRRCVPAVCGRPQSSPAKIKQAVLPPNPDQTTRARCCRLVLGAYLANFSGFFFALLDTPEADKAKRLGVLVSRYQTAIRSWGLARL